MKRKIESVLVLFGGVSVEHEVSCVSARNIVDYLLSEGVEVDIVGIARSGDWIPFCLDPELMISPNWEDLARAALPDTADSAAVGFADILSGGSVFHPREVLRRLCGGRLPQVVFPAVHGINCEDGTLQGFLEMCGLPYVGSPVTASALCMDKVKTKRILSSAGLPVCPFVPINRREWRQNPEGCAKSLLEGMELPLFIKPSNGGSSVGTQIVRCREELADAVETALQYDVEVLAEPYLTKREIEVAVLGNDYAERLSAGEVVMSESVDYYDYRTKYQDTEKPQSCLAIPPDLPAEMQELASRLAAEAYRLLGCRGLARVDFFILTDAVARNHEWSRHGLVINEINTLPGFTPISLYPRAIQYSGLSYGQLVLRLCELALESFESNRRLETFQPQS
ncbi:MAG: D-alanine--D-alanine ligase [Clostridiaceae bacterium]|nr:D-alanine--D-alanine ligase [Clostridiaceae bacterium]